MNLLTRHKIKKLIEDTNDAVESCDSVNMDYAAFAALSLFDFKEALNNPYLTGRDLRRIIRKGHKKYQADNTKACWATFVAGYIAQSSNENESEEMDFSLKGLYKK